MTTATTTTATTASLPSGVVAPPAWLGTRLLAVDEDGYGVVAETPPELQDRRFATIDLLPPPDAGAFVASTEPVPEDVLARSTWHEGCPVDPAELHYLKVSFWGFDGRAHTGELIVNSAVADDVIDAFHAVFNARYPIEEMRVVARAELDEPPTGDGNITSAFECREVTGGAGWSQHAFGLAVDVNPFHNPYRRGGRVLPELASAYLDRDRVRPGMILEGDLVTEAFAGIGWSWGGDFRSLTDPMHFSATGG